MPYNSAFAGLIGVLLLGGSRPVEAQSVDTTTFGSTAAPGSQSTLTLIREYIDADRWAEAEALLTQTVARQPRLSEAYLLRADLRREVGNLTGAIADYSVVVHLQPDHYEARFQRAQAYYAAEQYTAAREDFALLLHQEGGVTNQLFFRGDTDTGEFRASSATTLQSDMKADLLNYLGLCYWHTQDYPQAETHFNEAIAHNASDPMAYVNLGLTYEATGDTLSAVRTYRQALQQSPDHPTALRNLTALARQLNDTTLEQEALGSDDTQSYAAQLQRGVFHLRQGAYAAAIRHFSQALALSPQRTEALLQRGFAYEKAQRPDEARDDYTQVIRLDPTLAQAYANRAGVYFRQEMYEAALTDYQQALSIDSHDATILLNRGLTYHRLGKLTQACLDLQRAVKLGSTAAAKPQEKICGD